MLWVWGDEHEQLIRPQLERGRLPPQVLGQLTVGPLADYFGRRNMVFIKIAVMLLGVVIEITAPNRKVFTVAEFIMPYTAALLQSTAPLLVSELSPRCVRGIMMSAYPTIGETPGCHGCV